MSFKHHQERSFGFLSRYSFLELLIVLFSSCYLPSPYAFSFPELNRLNQTSYTSEYNPQELNQWFIPDKSVKALALVTHGLNLSPSKMNPLIEALNSRGIAVLRLSLTGHRGSLEEQKQVEFSQWLNDYKSAVELIEKAKSQLEMNNNTTLPLYSLSYSLGSVVHLNYILNSKEKSPFKSSVLFAPATWSAWYTSWPEFLFFLPDSFTIKSWNHQDYRNQPATSLACYRALREGVDNWVKLSKNSKKLDKLEPLLNFIDPNDELISLSLIKKFKNNHPSLSFQISLIENAKPMIDPSFHHLIIDKWAVGEERWVEILQNLFTYLNL